MSIAIFLLACLLLAFVFRLEGGGFYKFGNDTTPRIIRSITFGLVASYLFHDFNILHVLLLVAASFGASVIPHGYFQGMGSEPAPQSYWFTPWLRATTWTTWKMWQKMLYDFSGMAAVGLICGVITYIPYGLLTHAVPQSVHAALAVALLQPTAYAVGRGIAALLPFLFYSTEYGEALTGLGWAISIKAFLL